MDVRVEDRFGCLKSNGEVNPDLIRRVDKIDADGVHFTWEETEMKSIVLPLEHCEWKRMRLVSRAAEPEERPNWCRHNQPLDGYTLCRAERDSELLGDPEHECEYDSRQICRICENAARRDPDGPLVSLEESGRQRAEANAAAWGDPSDFENEWKVQPRILALAPMMPIGKGWG